MKNAGQQGHRTDAAKARLLTSRFLALVLRHQPDRLGISLDHAGWVEVDTLLAAARRHGFAADRPALEVLVRTNDKRRFAFDASGRRIRANQGHSVTVELGLPAVTPPERLYHGTVARFLPSIRAHGLQRGQRHHVHLSHKPATAVCVGARRGTPVVLVVDAAAMAAAGHAFFRAENGVWLTDEVPPAFLAEEEGTMTQR